MIFLIIWIVSVIFLSQTLSIALTLDNIVSQNATILILRLFRYDTDHHLVKGRGVYLVCAAVIKGAVITTVHVSFDVTYVGPHTWSAAGAILAFTLVSAVIAIVVEFVLIRRSRRRARASTAINVTGRKRKFVFMWSFTKKGMRRKQTMFNQPCSFEELNTISHQSLEKSASSKYGEAARLSLALTAGRTVPDMPRVEAVGTFPQALMRTYNLSQGSISEAPDSPGSPGAPRSPETPAEKWKALVKLLGKSKATAGGNDSGLGKDKVN